MRSHHDATTPGERRGLPPLHRRPQGPHGRRVDRRRLVPARRSGAFPS